MSIFSKRGQPKPPTLKWKIGLHPDDDLEFKKEEAERAWEYKGAFAALVITLLCLTAISGFMTFEGVLAERERDIGLDFDAVVHAVFVATAVTVTLFVGWHIILSLTPRMRRWYLRLTAYVFAVCFTAWALSISTWYNFVGLSGQSSLIMYMADATDRMSGAVDAVTAQASQARAVIPALDSVAASTCASYQGEVTQGLGTGGKGVGAYSQALLSACTATQKAVDSLKATAAKSEEEAVRLGETLRTLASTVVDRNLPILSREDAFRKGAADVDTLLRSVRNAGLRKTAEASLAALKSSVPDRPVDGGTFGVKQRALLDGLRQQMTGAITALESVLGGMSDDGAGTFKRAERLTLTEVSRLYILRSIPNLALAVGIDVFPLVMMAFLELAAAGKRRRKVRSDFNGFLDLDQTLAEGLHRKDQKGGSRSG
jgi:hypothetical protein